MSFQVYTFAELTTHQLYDILSLRNEVFIVEQNCPYQDLDGKDTQALHVVLYQENKLCAYARLFDAGINFTNASIGRVLVAPMARKQGLGHQLIHTCIQEIETHFRTSKITIAAQFYLENFYAQHGFVSFGELFLEDNIPHIHMTKE